MKRIMLKFSALFFLTFVLFSCNLEKGAKMETITGKSNEVVIVIGKEVWTGKVGSAIRQSLAQPQASLPQEEPIFSLINVPPEAFINIFKTSRNLITVKISPTNTNPKVEFTNDVYAYPQAVVNIQATSSENFEEMFNANSEKIIGFFLKAEKDRLKKTYKDAHDKSVYNTLLKDFNLKLYVPTGFKIVKKDSNFVWIRYDTPLITQNIVLYSYPYDSDSTFTPGYQLGKRNLMMKANVAGPLPGSYMTTEMEIPMDFNILNYNGNYASEMRGLWRVEKDFMGGPFVSLAVLDASRRRIVTVEGNVYAPKNSKRNYLRQVEAMIYSLEFPAQAISDKITKQLESGN
ncbi:MAG: DUF4837 family protein [Bacteroidota bacterium]|nr:DUF4837 family protein [Bacteroidota bacterium]